MGNFHQKIRNLYQKMVNFHQKWSIFIKNGQFESKNGQFSSKMRNFHKNRAGIYGPTSWSARIEKSDPVRGGAGSSRQD